MNFTGLCTYPLGGSVSAALILSCSAALGATVYAVTSCRFVVIEFTSDAGGFEDVFSRNRRDQDDLVVSYKAAVGLYQWLRPIDASWSNGSCAGYQETMLSSVTDTFFDLARMFGVFAVIMAILMTCWVFMLACLDMNRIQAILFCVLAFLATLSSGLTFLFLKSSLCETQFLSRSCSMDQGGLIMIAAVVLWSVTFGVSAFFVLPAVNRANRVAMDRMKNSKSKSKQKDRPPADKSSPNKTLPTNYSFDSQDSWTKRIPRRSATDQKRSQQQQQRSSQQRQRQSQQPRASQKQQQEVPRVVQPAASSRTRSSLTVDDVSKDDALEVYIAQRLDKIDSIAEV